MRFNPDGEHNGVQHGGNGDPDFENQMQALYLSFTEMGLNGDAALAATQKIASGLEGRSPLEVTFSVTALDSYFTRHADGPLGKTLRATLNDPATRGDALDAMTAVISDEQNRSQLITGTLPPETIINAVETRVAAAASAPSASPAEPVAGGAAAGAGTGMGLAIGGGLPGGDAPTGAPGSVAGGSPAPGTGASAGAGSGAPGGGTPTPPDGMAGLSQLFQGFFAMMGQFGASHPALQNLFAMIFGVATGGGAVQTAGENLLGMFDKMFAGLGLEEKLRQFGQNVTEIAGSSTDPDPSRAPGASGPGPSLS